jgi:hypothetical protein
MTTLYFATLAVTYLVNAAYFGPKLVAFSVKKSNRPTAPTASGDLQPRCCR